MQRFSPRPVTEERFGTDVSAIYSGQGFLSQLSYLFTNNWEIAGRYSQVVPFSELYNNPEYPGLNESQVQQVEVGVTKYLMGHRLKVQANVVRGSYTDLRADVGEGGFWSGIFQVEIGF